MIDDDDESDTEGKYARSEMIEGKNIFKRFVNRKRNGI